MTKWWDPETSREEAENEETKAQPNGHAPAKGNDNARILIQSGEGLTMEKIEWLWSGWLARGKFHLLAGGKAVGKSTHYGRRRYLA